MTVEILFLLLLSCTLIFSVVYPIPEELIFETFD